jgi:iron complex transport system permease protein
MLAAALLTGIIVSNCGVIGFVGLMVPHISRALVGADHRRLLPVAILLGGIFLTWADAFARIVIPGGELAIGIVTSMIGAPFFAYILVKRHYHFGS